MGKKLSDKDKAMLEQLQPVQEVLRGLVTALPRANPAGMPVAARALRDLTSSAGLSLVALTMMFDLADDIDRETGCDTES